MKTNKTLFTALISLLFLLASCGSMQEKQSKIQPGPYEPNWESLANHETPEWFEDAVLGIYFHWGVYSVPAFGCWGGRNMYQPNGGTSEAWGHIEDKYENTYDYVTKVYGKPGIEFGYKDFIPMFKAEKWDPEEWAALFKEAGADFAGPVAIHHDGFAMWDSEHHEYNSGDMGPKRDITGEMLEAVRKQGIKTFASFHYYTNWIYFNPGRTICPYKTDVNDPKYTGLYGSIKDINGPWDSGPMTEDFQQAWYDNVIEVINKYHPDQLWFEIGFSDEGNIGENYITSALANYFNDAEKLEKEVVVTRKDDDLPLSCSVLDIEAGELSEAQETVWQTDISLGMNHSWAYSPDAICRPVNMIIDEIVDRKSKNGVTLLSVAPKADGTLPPSQVTGLQELGKWMKINKEALYGSTPPPFAEGGTDQWQSGTMRFTQKGDYLYAIELGNEVLEMEEAHLYEDSKIPEAPFTIPGVEALEGSEIIILGSDEPLPWKQKGDNLIIEELPEQLPCDHAWAFKIKVLE
jgi:alpha-L-fucosidase